MAFITPTVKDLAQNARAAFRATMPGTDPWLWPSVLHVCAKVWAGIVWSLYGRLKQIDRARFAYTALGQELDLHGAEWGMARLPASFATGPVDLVGAAALVIPVGTTLTRSDGVAFITAAAVTLGGGGLATVYVTCVTAGSTGNTVYGTSLTLALVTSATVNLAGVGAGADIEVDESFRSRILFRKRYTPMSGSRTDYIAWATSVPGITRAYVDTSGTCNYGTVIVYPLADITQSANYGIPLAADVAAVQAYLNVVAPLGANVIAAAPVAYPINVIVSKSLTTSVARRQAASDELYATIRRTASVSVPSAVATVTLTLLWSALVQATGTDSLELLSPTADLVVPSGQIAVLHSVSFV